MIHEDEVKAAFRYCLGRNLSSDEPISHLMAMSGYRELRDYLMAQPEYISRVRPLLVPGADRNPYDDYGRTAIIFIHIQKSAGTTVTTALERNFPPDRCCPERFNHLYKYSPGELSKFDVYSGHFDLFSTKYIPREKKFIFTVFRDPIERLISFYRFVKAHPKGAELRSDPLFALADEASPEEYFSHASVRASPLVNNHYRCLLSGSIGPGIPQSAKSIGDVSSAIKALSQLDAVGLTSRLTESLECIFSTAGLPPPNDIKSYMKSDSMHISDTEVRAPISVEFSSGLREKLDGLVADDLKIYEEAIVLFQEQWRIHKSLLRT